MSILLEELQFAFPKQALLLDIPHWALGSQERVFLWGASGSGKSTLLNLMAGLLKPSSGKLMIGEQDMSQMKARHCDRFRANHIGFVFQQFNLIGYLDAVDNIRLAARFGSAQPHQRELLARIESLLGELNIDKSLWHQPAMTLSIGQQQRIAIARALINEPAMLIADEPTSALDANNRNAFIRLLLNTVEARSMAMVFVSHDQSLAKHFDRTDNMDEINRVGR